MFFVFFVQIVEQKCQEFQGDNDKGVSVGKSGSAVLCSSPQAMTIRARDDSQEDYLDRAEASLRVFLAFGRTRIRCF